VSPGGKKQLPPPAAGNLTEMLRARRAATTPAADPEPVPPPAPVVEAKPPAPVRRSWYLPASAAEALIAAVDDLHFETRVPKHVVHATLIAVALEHLDEIRRRLPNQTTAP
jgi:hypothetical protein